VRQPLQQGDRYAGPLVRRERPKPSSPRRVHSPLPACGRLSADNRGYAAMCSGARSGTMLETGGIVLVQCHPLTTSYVKYNSSCQAASVLRVLPSGSLLPLHNAEVLPISGVNRLCYNIAREVARKYTGITVRGIAGRTSHPTAPSPQARRVARPVRSFVQVRAAMVPTIERGLCGLRRDRCGQEEP
jgi:hypothetical protein